MDGDPDEMSDPDDPLERNPLLLVLSCSYPGLDSWDGTTPLEQSIQRRLGPFRVVQVHRDKVSVFEGYEPKVLLEWRGDRWAAPGDDDPTPFDCLNIREA